jgi:hypothetical protein
MPQEKTDPIAEAVRNIVATIFSAQNALRVLAPEYKWKGMGNLLGDYGEFLARERYGLKKAPAGSDGYDALTPDGRRVQVKANHSSSTIGFRGKADLLLVLHVEDDGSWRELYYGDFASVLKAAHYSKRDNKHMIQVSKLAALGNSTTTLLQK